MEHPLPHTNTSRRNWLEQLGKLAGLLSIESLAGPTASLCLQLIPRQGAQPLAINGHDLTSTTDSINYKFTPEQDAFLEQMEVASFRYFWDHTNPDTGLTRDRALAIGPETRVLASIAAAGFALAAMCIADKRGWEDRKKIRERVRNSLRFAAERLVHQHGFFFHFLNINTGEREGNCELSSMDSSLFLCGVLCCAAYFEDAEISKLAAQIYERVDWVWFLQDAKTLSMGWTPENGFLKARWDSYSELMMIYLLGLGSPKYPLPAESWDAWERPIFEFEGMRYIGAHAPLFVNQYSHAWFDFREKRDKYANYFQNSIIATKVHKLWCLKLAKQFPDYAENLWGVSASDTMHGYEAWGGPPPMGSLDGSIVPCAAGGSLPFLPMETLLVLHTIREKYPKAWSKYGFVDAFNPLRDWYNPDVLGIDAGITLLMAENARTGFIWEQFMKNEAVQRGMHRAGFRAA